MHVRRQGPQQLRLHHSSRVREPSHLRNVGKHVHVLGLRRWGQVQGVVVFAGTVQHMPEQRLAMKTAISLPLTVALGLSSAACSTVWGFDDLKPARDGAAGGDDAATGDDSGDAATDGSTMPDGGGNACDLADPNSCGGGSNGCLANSSSGGATHCGAMGSGQQGVACTGPDTQCAPGYSCENTGGPSGCSAGNCECERWCRYPVGSCPPGKTCHGDGTLRYNAEAYGWCY